MAEVSPHKGLFSASFPGAKGLKCPTIGIIVQKLGIYGYCWRKFVRPIYIYGFVWKCWVYSQWNSHLVGIVWSAKPLGVVAIFRHTHMAMDQYLYIPFLGGWTSICQLYIYIYKTSKKIPQQGTVKSLSFPRARWTWWNICRIPPFWPSYSGTASCGGGADFSLIKGKIHRSRSEWTLNT